MRRKRYKGTHTNRTLRISKKNTRKMVQERYQPKMRFCMHCLSHICKAYRTDGPIKPRCKKALCKQSKKYK